jgi:hypothetical protein
VGKNGQLRYDERQRKATDNTEHMARRWGEGRENIHRLHQPGEHRTVLRTVSLLYNYNEAMAWGIFVGRERCGKETRMMIGRERLESWAGQRLLNGKVGRQLIFSWEGAWVHRGATSMRVDDDNIDQAELCIFSCTAQQVLRRTV